MSANIAANTDQYELPFVSLTVKSGNKKTGPIPVSMTASKSCPTCPFKGNGCYAENAPLVWRWQELDSGSRGTDWNTFTAQIAALPAGTTWRHNAAGDLPGGQDRINADALDRLVTANIGRLGYTYTHYPMDRAENRQAVADANARGFAINLSAGNLKQADEYADLGIAPVVVVVDVPEGKRFDTTTPAGRKVTLCPAQYRDDVTCKSCKLCARRDRKVIVGFAVHGNRSKVARIALRGKVA